jgi:hypothetical protein
LGSTLLIFTWHTFAYQPAQPECTRITLKLTLTAGQSYEQRIGGNLTLKVMPSDGWTFSLEDAASHDYIAPVNPPLRFNPLQTLGPGYSLSAKESLKWDREVRFILNEPDYKRIHQLWHYALWPADAPDPDHAIENYVGTIKQLRTGFLRVSILQSDVSPDDIVRSATFSWEFTAPSEFSFNPALGPQPAACPAAAE